MMSIKVCLISSIRNKFSTTEEVKKIVNSLQENHYQVLHEHVSEMDQQILNNFPKHTNIQFHQNIFANIRKSDLVISECSNESLSVGFLLSYALEHDKPIVIFIKMKSIIPNLFTYLSEEKRVYIVEYSSSNELSILVKDYMKYALENLDSRFNFYLPPNIAAYLTWISKKHNQSKSAFVRKMLQEKMTSDVEYVN